jgi:hypothetical protein
MEEGLRCFMWYESTIQPEGKFCLDCGKIGDVVHDRVLGCKEPTLKEKKFSIDEDVALDVW